MPDPEPDSNDGQEKPSEPPTPGEGKKVSPVLPNSVSFDEGQPLSTPQADEGSTQGVPPATPLTVERSNSWTMSPTPPQPSQGAASDVSRVSILREPVPPPRDHLHALHAPAPPCPQPPAEVVPLDTDEKDTTDTGMVWCHLVPVKCTPPMAPIAVSATSLSLGLTRKIPQPKPAKDKVLFKIVATKVPYFGSNVCLESLSAGLFITVNDITVPKSGKCPLSHGDEVAFHMGGVVNVFTVLIDHTALAAVLQKKEKKPKERVTPPPPEEGKTKRRVLGDPSVQSCAVCNTLLLGWFKVCPGCAAPVNAPQAKQKIQQCLMCHKFTGGAALCHICNYGNVPPNLLPPAPQMPTYLPQIPQIPEAQHMQQVPQMPQVPPPMRMPSQSYAQLAHSLSQGQAPQAPENALQKIQALRQYMDTTLAAPPKKKRKTEPLTHGAEQSSQAPQVAAKQVPVPTQAQAAPPVDFAQTEERKRCIAAAASELSQLVVPPDDNTVVFDSTFPYYLDPTERQQIHHALFLNMFEGSRIRCLDNMPKTLGLRVDSASCDIKCEMVLKGMAKELGSFFLSFDPSTLRSTLGEPKPLQQLDLHVAQPYSLRGGKGQTPRVSTATLQAPFISGSSHTYDVGDRVMYQPAACDGNTCIKGSKGKVLVTFPNNLSSKRVGVCFDTPQPNGTDLGGQCPSGRGLFVDPAELRPDNAERCNVALHALFKVMESYQPLIVYIRGTVGRYILNNAGCYASLKSLLAGLRSRVCVGLSIVKQEETPKKHRDMLNQATSMKEASKVKKQQAQAAPKPTPVPTFADMLPNTIDIAARPVGKEAGGFKDATLSMWKNRLETDRVFLRVRSNVLLVQELLDENHLHCTALCEMCNVLGEMRPENYQLSVFDALGPSMKMLDLTPDHVQQALSWALAQHLQQNKTLMYTQEESQKLMLALADINHGVSLFGRNHKHTQAMLKKGAFEGLELDSEYETKLLGDVIPAGSVRVSFNDIGALHKVKEVLKEVVLQPLQRPGLFSRSKLTVPSKGVLLFGPPGTGKTMVAKAIATSVRASFLCVSASTVTSKWVGEGEKYAAAVFGLASKIAPCIVFIDEIDALLSKRGDKYEHESSRKIKNEIMSSWDGMHSHEQVMVIGATNRPQDLDDAVLRRLNRRLLVDLPDKQCRVEILKVLLKDENVAAEVSLEDVASNTPGYTGSDLRNLCITAAYRPIKRYLKEHPVDDVGQDDPFVEKEMRMLQEGEDAKVQLGSILKADFDAALKVVTATVHEDAPSIEELRRWNDMYGEEGSRRAGNLPYFM